MTMIQTEKKKREIEATRLRCNSLSGFVKESWKVLEPNQELTWGWHLDAICDHLEAVTDGRINRLLINVPPGSSKSLLVSVMWQAWEWGPKGMHSKRFLTTSFNDGPVKRDTRKTRDLILSSWYQSLWPEVRLSRAGETSFANDGTGTREGVSFGSLTSQRGDRLIIDDPHSTETAESTVERENTTRKFREGASNRLNDQDKSAIVVIMQRLHGDDVSGVIHNLKLGYVHLCLPMEFIPEERCSTCIGFSDPRENDGDLLDPNRFPHHVVEALKRDMGPYAYASQYQQKPSPRSGGLFQRGWFEVVDSAPAGGESVRSWDFAATREKIGANPDYTVGLRMTKSKEGIYYIEDVVRDRLDAFGVENLLLNIASQDGYYVDITIPQDPGQAGKSQAQQLTAKLSGYVVDVAIPTGDKTLRARSLSAQAKAGNVKLVRGAWNEDFLAELASFPTGRHDDQVDAASDSFNYLSLSGKVIVFSTR